MSAYETEVSPPNSVSRINHVATRLSSLVPTPGVQILTKIPERLVKCGKRTTRIQRAFVAVGAFAMHVALGAMQIFDFKTVDVCKQ